MRSKVWRAKSALIGFGVDPDGEKFGAQISAAGFVEADVAGVFGIGRTDVEAFVEEALRGVGVGVDDDGRIVNLAGARADDHVGCAGRCLRGLGECGGD